MLLLEYQCFLYNKKPVNTIKTSFYASLLFFNFPLNICEKGDHTKFAKEVINYECKYRNVKLYL